MATETTQGFIGGAIGGAAAGAPLGPYGMLAGAIIGGVLGGISGSEQEEARKRAEREAEMARVRSITRQYYAQRNAANSIQAGSRTRSSATAQNMVSQPVGYVGSNMTSAQTPAVVGSTTSGTF